jgi:hypothetical protein
MHRSVLARGDCYLVRVSIDLRKAPHEAVRGVAERRSRQEDPGSETARNVSRGASALLSRFSALVRGVSPVGAAVTALGAIGGVLMIISSFLTVVSIDVANGACAVIYDSDPKLADGCVRTGFERHSVAIPLLGLLVLVMAVGAGRGRSRPAAGALVAIGAVVLAIALFSDLPVTSETGAIGRNFEGATAAAGSGLYVEIAAGVAAIGAGLIGLVLPGPKPEPERRQRREPT